MQVCRDVLAPAVVSTREITDKGPVEIKREVFMRRYSTPLEGIIADATRARGFVDDDGYMHEPACRLRKISAKYDSRVDEYIELVGGSRAEQFRDWLATCVDLSRPACGLYIEGVTGTGKTFLPTMLSRMYVGRPAPAELSQVLGNFNEDLTKTPIVFADEKIDKRTVSSADLRKLIGARSFSLKRKHNSNATILVCPRVMIGGNNKELISFNEEMSTEDQKAVEGRFLFLRTNANIGEWIVKNGGITLTDYFAAGAFEQHIVWLAQERAVAPTAD